VTSRLSAGNYIGGISWLTTKTLAERLQYLATNGYWTALYHFAFGVCRGGGDLAASGLVAFY
jgi:hypothetical protein